MVNQKADFRLVKHMVDAFKAKYPDVQITEEFNEAVNEVERQNTIFEQGANAKFKKWRNFSSGLYAQRNAEIPFQSVEDLNYRIHGYMDWQKTADNVLTDAEKAQYTVQNYKMNNKANPVKFLKYYRKDRKNGVKKGIIKSFKEYKAKINEGSYRYFLKNEYKNAANNVIVSLNEAEKAAKNIDIDLYEAIHKRAINFEDSTLLNAKQIERRIFGKSYKKAGRTGLIVGLAALGVLGIRQLYKYFTESDALEKELSYKWQQTNNAQKQPNTQEEKADNNTTVIQQEKEPEQAVKEVTDNAGAKTDSVVTESKSEKNKAFVVPQIFYQFNGLNKTKSAEEQEVLKSVDTVSCKKEVAKEECAKIAEPAKTDNSTKDTKVPTEQAVSTDEADKDAQKAKARQAFESAINQVRQHISTDGVTTDDYKVVSGDSFWRISQKILKSFGEENPENKQIIKMIALLAELNNFDSVTGHMLRPNDVITVPTNISNSADDASDTESDDKTDSGNDILDRIFDSEEMNDIDFDKIYQDLINSTI